MSFRSEESQNDDRRLAAFFAGELDARDEAELIARLRVDENLRRRWAEIASDELALDEALGKALPSFTAPPEALSSSSRTLRPWRFIATAAAVLAMAALGWWFLRSDAVPASSEGTKLSFVSIREGAVQDLEALQSSRPFDAPPGLVLDFEGTTVAVRSAARLIALAPLEDPRDARDRERAQLAVFDGHVEIDNPAGHSGLRLLTPAGVLRDLGTHFYVRVDALGGTDDMGTLATLTSLSARVIAPALVTAGVYVGSVGFEASSAADPLAQEQVLTPEMGSVTLSADNSIAVLIDREGLTHRRELGSERWQYIADDARFLPGTWLSTGARGAHALRIKLSAGAVITAGPGASIELIDAQSLRLHAGEARVQSADEAHATLVEGPGGASTRVTGTQYLRAEDRKLTSLSQMPKWLAGYDEGRPTEALGALLAKVDGRNVPLSIGYHKVNIDVRDQIARTTIEQSFVNHTSAVLEGTFYFPLPDEASVSSFALFVGNQWIEGEVVEKERAREIYETLLREKRDPGLLEWAGGNLFKARVYPIGSEKRVKIVYTQVLPRSGDGYRYRYPLKSELTTQRPLQRLELDFTVSSSEEIVAVESPTHSCRVQSNRNAARLEHSAEEVTPRSDFEVIVRTKPTPARFLPHRRGDDGYFVLLFDAPRSNTEVAPEPGEWIFVCDTSASSERSRVQQQDLLEAMLKGLGAQDRFQLATFDVDIAWAFDSYRAVDAESRKLAENFLAARIPLGWTRFEPAFEQVFARTNAKTRVVYLGDGIATGGERNQGNLLLNLERLRNGRGEVHTIGLGSQRDRLMLEGLARFDGTTRNLNEGDDTARVAEQALREIAAPGVRDIQVEFDGLSVAAMHPARLPRIPAGEQALLVGRFDPATAALKAKLRIRAQQGAEELVTDLDLDTSKIDASNDFAPRLWARRRLDHLLEQGDSAAMREHIIALSEDFQIITPYTSFLVLETVEDRERFNVEKKMRMRDGEIFFAAARDDAQSALRADALRLAKGWRQSLRAQFLRSIRDMGRDQMTSLRLDVEQLAWGSGPMGGAIRGRSRDAVSASTIRMPRSASGEKSKSLSAGEDFEAVEGKKSFDDAERWYSDDAKLGEVALDPYGYTRDFDVESENLGLDLDGFLQRNDAGSYAGLSAAVGSRKLQSRRQVFKGGAEPNTNVTVLPNFASPSHAVRPIELDPQWPAEVRALIAELQLRTQIAESKTSVICSASSERLDAREQVDGTRTSELIISPVGWWWSGHAAAGEAAVREWLFRGQRAALDATWSMGSWRTAVASDQNDWPAGLPWIGLDWARAYQSYRASFERGEDGTRILVFSDTRAIRGGASTTVRLEIDPDRAFVRSRRVYASGQLEQIETCSDPEQIAGAWWPKRYESRDAEGRLLARWNFTPRQIDDAAAERELSSRVAIADDTLLIGEFPTDTLKALDAARAGRASIEELMLLVNVYGGAGRWEIATPYVEALLAAIAGKRGKDRIALALRIAERRLEAARQVVLAIARELATNPRDADAAAANDLYQHCYFASVGERQEIAAVLEAVHLRQSSAEARAIAALRSIGLYDELGFQKESEAAQRRFAEEQPTLLSAQFLWIRWLAEQDRLDEALAKLRAERGSTPWRLSERREFHEMELQLLLNARRFEAFALRFEELQSERAIELPSFAFERYPTALVSLERIDVFERVITTWMNAGASSELDAAQQQQLDAAIEHALGRASGLYRGRFDERFESMLAEFLSVAGEREEHASRVQRILDVQGFRNTTAGQAWLLRMQRRLEQDANALSLATAVRFTQWMQLYREIGAEGEELARRLVNDLLARYENQDVIDEDEQLSQFLIHRGKPEERARYWERRLQRSQTELEVLNARAAWFEALLGCKWSAAIEDRQLALWPLLGSVATSLQPERVALDAHLERIRALWRITTTSEVQRVEAAMSALEGRDELDRRGLKAARDKFATAARAAVDARLGAIDRSQLPGGLEPWLTCESIYFATRAGADRGAQWQRTFELLKQLPAPTTEKPELDRTGLADRLLSTAAWFSLLGSLNEDVALVPLLSWVREQPRSDFALFDPREWETHLLLGADRAEELATRLAQWFGDGAASIHAPAGIFLAQIQAETDALDAAIATLRRVALHTPLNFAELELLATWQHALGMSTELRAARDAAWAALSESELQEWLQGQIRLVNPRGSAVPANLDPETPHVLAILLRKAAQPSQYVWTFRSLYRATRDPRLFGGLAEGVIGTTIASACELLENLQGVLHDDLQEESAVDVAAGAVDRVRATQPSTIDLRCLDLLELMLRVRAVELSQLDRTHVEAALAAFDRVDRAEWKAGETMACARWLAELRKVRSPELRQRIRRQFAALKNAAQDHALSQSLITLIEADWLWTNELHEDALAAQQSGLATLSALHDGVLPMAYSGRLESYAQRLRERSRWADAERVWTVELARFSAPPPTLGTDRFHWIERELFEFYALAFQHDATTSLGQGIVLWRALDKRFDAACEGTPSPDHIKRLISVRAGMWKHAAEKGYRDEALTSLMHFARQTCVALLTRHHYEDGQAWIATLADTISTVGGPVLAVRYFVERAENEPQSLALSGNEFWSQHSWRFSKAVSALNRTEEELNARVLAVVSKVLRADLRSQYGNARYLYSTGSNYWSPGTRRYLEIAQEVMEERGDREGIAIHIGRYVLDDLNKPAAAAELLLGAEGRGVLSFGGQNLLASALRRAGQHSEAAERFAALALQRPEMVDLHTELLRSLFDAGRRPELLPAFQRAVVYFETEAQRANVDARMKLGWAALDCNLLEESVAILREAIVMHTRASASRGIGDGVLGPAYEHLASALSRLGRTREAIDAASAGILARSKRNDQRAVAEEQLRDVIRGAEDLAALRAEFDAEAASTGQQIPLLRQALGEVFLERKDFAAAAEQLVLAADLVALDVEKLVLLLQALDGAKRTEEADARLLQGARMSTGNRDLWIRLAARYAARELAVAAERARTSVVEIEPLESEAHQLLAEAREQQRDFPQALREWTTVAELATRSPLGLLGRARVLIAMNRLDEARAALAEVRKQNFDSQFKKALEELPRLEALVPR